MAHPLQKHVGELPYTLSQPPILVFTPMVAGMNYIYLLRLRPYPVKGASTFVSPNVCVLVRLQCIVRLQTKLVRLPSITCMFYLIMFATQQIGELLCLSLCDRAW